MPDSPPRKPTLRVTITGAFVSMILIIAAINTGLSYFNSTKTIAETSRTVLQQVAERINERTASYLGPVADAARTTARMAATGQLIPGDLDSVEAAYFAVMTANREFASLDYGDDNGNFLMVKRMPDRTLATKIVRRSGDTVTAEWRRRARGAGLHDIAKVDPEAHDTYDPRTRPWFKGAKGAKGLFWTDVYVFATDKKPAITASLSVPASGGGQAVTSASITLGDLSEFLGSIRLSENARVFVIDHAGRVIGYPELSGMMVGTAEKPELPTLEQTGKPVLQAVAKTSELQAALSSGARAEMFHFALNGEPYFGTILPLSYKLGGGWLIGAAIPENDFLGQIKADAAKTLAVTLAIAVIMLLITLVIARRVTQPLNEIAEETRVIRNLEFDDRPMRQSSFEEISEILRAYANMKVGLRAFQKYVPYKLVRILLESGEDPKLGGRTEDLTIFFSDIKGFSSFSEKMKPQELAEMLGEYLQTMTDTVMETGGTVDKFIGDAVMAFWNAPRPVEDHAYQGVLAAIRCQEAIAKLKDAQLLYTRIGLHTANVMVGNFGSSERLSYTVLGDGVNLASRLEGVNKEYGTQILCSDALYERVKDRFDFRKLDLIAVKGKAQPTAIFEVLGEKGKVDAARNDRARDYEAGLEHYFARKFEDAIACFDRVLASDPGDLAADVMRERCADFKQYPPKPDWNGVYEMKTK